MKAAGGKNITARRLAGHGIRVLDLNDVDAIGIYVDGADEIDGSMAMIKGGGGALTREKIVAAVAGTFVCICDASKRVQTMGRFPLPVEVTPFGHEATARRIAALGGAPVLRQRDGAPFRTDNGSFILDCPGFAPVRDPFTLDRVLRSLAGVVCTGLFLLPVERALVGHEDGRVEELLP